MKEFDSYRKCSTGMRSKPPHSGRLGAPAVATAAGESGQVYEGGALRP